MAFLPNVQGIRVTGSLTGMTSITVTGNTFLNTVTANTLTVTGNTKLASVTANTLTVTGNTSLSAVTASTITANTISATTYYGNGSNLTNIPNIYNINGSLSGNRVVNISGYSLNFSGSVAPNNLYLSGGSVGIGTNTVSSSALLEISSTTKGFLGPRMTEVQRLAIASPSAGLVVYQTDNDEGYYIYKSFGWVQII